MKMPLFLIDRGDISIFSSSQDLLGYVESPDISDYLVFDAVGCQLELQSVIGRGDMIFDVNKVCLVEMDGMSPQPGTLCECIRSFLSSLNVFTYERIDLSELVDIMIEKIGYTK